MSLIENLLGRTLIGPDDTWGLLGVMCLSVALSIFLEQKYRWAARVSGSIIALILAMAMANIGVIPISSVLYDDIVWGVIVPMGIPLLLLQCNLKKIWREAGKMLTIFLIGAVGTVTRPPPWGLPRPRYFSRSPCPWQSPGCWRGLCWPISPCPAPTPPPAGRRRTWRRWPP